MKCQHKWWEIHYDYNEAISWCSYCGVLRFTHGHNDKSLKKPTRYFVPKSRKEAQKQAYSLGVGMDQRA